MISSVRFIVRPLAAACLLAGFGSPRIATAAPDAGRSPLGMMPPEIVSRYGPVLRHNARVRHHQILEGGTVLDGDLHGKNGLIIRVVYHQNRAVLLEFTRAAGSMAAADIDMLLTTCADGSTWEMGKDSTEVTKFYRRADNRAVAHWSVADSSLLVAAEGDNQTGDLLDRLLP